MTTLTDLQTAKYEHARQTQKAALTPEEQAANALLDAAAQTNPAKATEALHTAMYLTRMGAILEAATPKADLWVLGVLGALDPDAGGRLAVFGRHARALADYRDLLSGRAGQHDRRARMLHVAHSFASAVARAQRDQTSPADALRMMLRDRDRFDALMVHALRHALARPNAAAAA